MATVGLRELRQDASEVIRRVEGGEPIDVTVSGRLAARIVPVQARQWLNWLEVADCFAGPADPDWARDRDLLPQDIQDPWARGRGSA